ncbi:hypothetical protein [Polyangium spumosum]|uniref:Radical SAM protein n=1 Tax=Polyangium spumosum TaxID=889282 RepID=A0A6N7PWE2_9BACT|nr:hypothetical protein [Polyangium spumosum]MRG95156.1 hypothetical protein [Polyangium spumosum]
MDLDRHLAALLAPLAPGDELMKGARITSLSTELGLRVTVDVGGRDVHLEIARVEDGGRFAARTERLLFRYRDGAGRGDVDPALGLALCKALAARASARELDEAGARVREVRVSCLLTTAGAPGERHHTLSPYVGCLVGCRFCYAQSRVVESRRLARLPEVPWGSYVDVRINAPEVLADELERLPRWPIKFCPIVSDPYHPIERRYGLTRAHPRVPRDHRGRSLAAPRPRAHALSPRGAGSIGLRRAPRGLHGLPGHATLRGKRPARKSSHVSSWRAGSPCGAGSCRPA